MTFKRVFGKLGRRKKDGIEVRQGSPKPETPSPEASVRITGPKPVSLGAVSTLVHHSSSQMQASTTGEHRQMETPSTSRDTWTNLNSFLHLLNRTPIFGPLAVAIDNLSWFINAHEDVIATQVEYETLQTQLEALFSDLCGHFSENTPPTMTTSMLNLCGAIETELKRVYDTDDRNQISRYMQADYDLGKITECYRRIHGHLERVMFNASLNTLKMVDKQTTDAQLRNLNPSMAACYDSAEANVVQRRECAPKTREQVCWINGMAGTGKTTIATTLCSTLDKIHELGASFFCTRSIPACRDVKLILPTIAYQLARFSSPFRGALLRVLDRDADVHTKVPRVQFQRMILEPLREVIRSLPTNIIVVVDALDECDDGNGVSQILEVLLERASNLPVKFLVSSRPEYHIRESIKKSSLKAQLILHELDDKMVKEDIETYLRAETSFLSTPLTNFQLLALVERAGVLFIYAATVVRYIKAGEPLERLDAVLKEPGPGSKSSNRTKEIDTLYQTVLTSAFNNEDLEDAEKDRMELVLHTVVCAQEPLTAGALARLLELTPPQVMAALKPFWSVLHLSTSDTSHRVSTLHASFPDYMLNPVRSKEFACNLEMHSRKLAELCLRRISRNSSQFNICGLESSYVLDEDVPELDEKVKRGIPFDLLYASQYWATHLSLGGKPNELAGELHDFLSKRLLLWMEILNLSKRIDRAVGQMEKVISWLKPAEQSQNKTSLIRDALRFVTMFATSPISESTPHLYVSMLSLWPAYQPVSRCYDLQSASPLKVTGIETIRRQLYLLSSTPAGAYVYCVAFSPDGAFFAAGTTANTIQIWDAISCQMTIDPMRGHTNAVRAIAISPDSTQVCSGSQDNTLRIWDPRTGRQVSTPLEGHTDWVFSVSYSPDGLWLASGSADGTIRIWDTYNWRTKGRPLNGYGGAVYSVAFSPDSSLVAAGTESTVHIWDPLTGHMIGESFKGHTEDIWALSFMPDGKHLVSGSTDRTIRVWDIGTGQTALGPFQEHMSTITSLTISPDGNLLASTATDNTIRIWDTKSWTTRALFQHTGIARSVAFSPDGSRLLSGSLDGNIRLWETPVKSDEIEVETRSEGHDGQIRSIEFSPCGAYIVSGSDDRTVRIWDAENGDSIGSPIRAHDDWVIWVGILAGGTQIFSISRDRTIHVWDRKSHHLEYKTGPVETDGNYDAQYQEDWPAIFSSDNRRLVCGSKSGRIYMWENDELISELTGHSEGVYSLAFSPNGQLFASGDGTGNLILWDACRGARLLGPFKAHSDSIYAVSFSPDGLLVASGSDDLTIRVWDTDTGSPVGNHLRGHTRVITSVAISYRGERLASGSQDMTIRLWEISSGQSIAVFEGHTDLVQCVAFSSDGARVASGSADTTIRIWNAPGANESSILNHLESSLGELENTAEDTDNLYWTMDERGWVRVPERHFLLWVPPDLRSALLRPQNTMLISSQGCIKIDFSGARVGEAWETCFEPFPPAIGS